VRSRRISWRASTVVSIATLIALSVQSIGRSAEATLPPALANYLQQQKFTAEQRAKVQAGEAVTQMLDADANSEVAILGVVWIGAPVEHYLAAVRDIEQFERGGNFLVTKRISTPPRPEDFDALTLADEDVADLKDCRIGSCDVKLGAPALARLQKSVDWSRPSAAADANTIMRALALEYVNGYLEGGNARLAVYRDSDRPSFVSKEFASLIARTPPLSSDLQNLKRYLLDYPVATLPQSESYLYWQKVKFGLKPTIRINHVTIVPQSAGAIVTSKMLYASHYFWTALELRALIPDPARGQGFWFVSVNRSRSDGLSGFKGTMIRGRVRSEAQNGMKAAMEKTKAKLENGS
jgi:hypothetical protein